MLVHYKAWCDASVMKKTTVLILLGVFYNFFCLLSLFVVILASLSRPLLFSCHLFVRVLYMNNKGTSGLFYIAAHLASISCNCCLIAV